MKVTIEKHKDKGNIINSYSWPTYNFLDNRFKDICKIYIIIEEAYFGL